MFQNVATTCIDIPEWKDNNNHDCSVYQKFQSFACTDGYANSKSVDGVTALDACCACGGGEIEIRSDPEDNVDTEIQSDPKDEIDQNELEPEDGIPSESDQEPSDSCVNLVGWMDNNNHDCTVYEKFQSFACSSAYADSKAVDGVSGVDACCACGGGSPPVSTDSTDKVQDSLSVGPIAIAFLSLLALATLVYVCRKVCGRRSSVAVVNETANHEGDLVLAETTEEAEEEAEGELSTVVLV